MVFIISTLVNGHMNNILTEKTGSGFMFLGHIFLEKKGGIILKVNTSVSYIGLIVNSFETC